MLKHLKMQDPFGQITYEFVTLMIADAAGQYANLTRRSMEINPPDLSHRNPYGLSGKEPIESVCTGEANLGGDWTNLL